MKVFVSSVVDGYEKFRSAVKDAIEALGHVPVLMDRTHPASPDSPQVACLQQVADSDVVVLLIGARYGDAQSSGKSATHEEWDQARSLKKKVLVFVEEVDERESEQAALLEEVGDYENGRLFVTYSTPMELLPKVVRSLRGLESDSDDSSDQDAAARLPPVCRDRVESLRAVSPAVAARLVSLLSDPGARTPGGLSRLVDEPPAWLTEAGHIAWEAISDFLNAHDLPGSDSTRRMAIEAGSPRSAWYLIRQAAKAAEEGDARKAEGLLTQVPSEYPLLAAAQALINGDASSVVKVLKVGELHTSQDPDLALNSMQMMVWAYERLEELDLMTEVLKTANLRFPDRADLLLRQAASTLGVVDQVGLESSGSHDLLSEAAKLALRSRDCFRSWDGPSHHAVAVATRVLLFLEDPQQVVDLASRWPNGEATESEATAPAVQRNVAYAYLMLGRPHDIDTLSIRELGTAEATLIRAMQAYSLDDDAAPSRARRALAQADDDMSRRRALFQMAVSGEVDEAALAEVSEAEAALFRGMAALNGGAIEEAISLLVPYRLESPIHTHYLAQALHQHGETEEAVESLVNAAEHLGAVPLWEDAAELLFEQRKFDEATSMAKDILARGPTRASRHRMRTLLVGVADHLRDWQSMESYARVLTEESPEDVQAAWHVVYALHRQGRNRQAWGFLVGHDLIPFSEDTAQLAIAVCGSVDAPEQDAERLLRIAGMYTDSEEVVGSVISTLIVPGDGITLSEDRRQQLHELAEDFIARYPDSDIFRACSAESLKEFLKMTVAAQQSQAEQSGPLINKVRYGRLPYGVLLWVRPDLTYTDVLLSLAAGWLTAIHTDEDQRAKERHTARQAMSGTVAVDTSVAALGICSGLDVADLGSVFGALLVADELIIDARWTVTAAKAPVAATVGYDPVLARPAMTEIDEDQRRTRLEKAESALEVLSGWQRVTTGHLPPLSELEQDGLKPWDASLRVASSVDGCALWCDDVALRILAESLGIPAFGTWALYEALSITPDGMCLPTATDMKMRLLRSRIADVPISLRELADAADESDGPDIAVGCFLSRPHIWQGNRSEAFTWYLHRAQTMIHGPYRQQIPGLLYAACQGLGAAMDASVRVAAMGAVLAATLATVGDPKMVPMLVAASRYAANDVDPSVQCDPLLHAVRHLLRSLEPAVGTGPAARMMTLLFSDAEYADRNAVTSVILGDR